LLDLTGIPYVGAGVLASAAGMDKDIMKRLYRDAGLPVVPWVLVKTGEWQAAPARVIRRILQHLQYPIFVKPANLGSSVGISKVHRRSELAPAIDLAARYDRRIVVEQGIDAREFECSVLGNDEARASVPGEVISGREFYDYTAKYLEEGSRTVIPAPLQPQQTRTLQKLALAAFHAIDCAGMARVDFFMERASGAFYVNEINTIPGFTAISMYPKMWEASGLPLPGLLDQLIALAIERQQKRMALQFRRME
jgi:D-alanine-D-alanine ligase